MGYIRHHAIVVTGTYEKWLEKAHKKAERIFPGISGVVAGTANGTYSFFIPPDGSKEGWDESDSGDKRRSEFVRWLEARRYEDGSSPLAWVEVQYGDDNRETIVVNHSDAAPLKDPT